MLAARAALVSYPAGCLARSLSDRKVPDDCSQSFNDEYNRRELVLLPGAKQRSP
jgi:hypothetical protein